MNKSSFRVQASPSTLSPASKNVGHPKTNDQWTWINSLPNSPYQDYNTIKFSGISEEDVLRGVNVLAFFTDVIKGKGWGAVLGRRLNMTEVHVREVDGGSVQAEVVIETTVMDDMLNPFRSLHGSCSAWLVDMCSSTPLVTLGLLKKTDSSGMSQAMNLIYHGLAPLGTELKIVSTSVTNQGKIRVSRCEIINKKTNALVVSAMHTKVGGATKAVAKL